MRLFISGGGTGGHVYPALAVVEQLKSREPAGALPAALGSADAPREPWDILWLGSRDGVERRLVEAAGLPFQSIETGALRGRSPLAAVRNLGKMTAGVRQALGYIDQHQPDVCFVTGGYVCAPVTVACRMRSKPVLVYLPDMTPGLAIRWLSRLAKRVAVSFPEVASYFGAKAVVTGYPVRTELVRAAEDVHGARQVLAQALGIDWSLQDQAGQELPLLLVFGGSQGARSINRAIWRAAPELVHDCQILHVIGQRDWPLLEEEGPDLPPELSRRYHPATYLHQEMPYALSAADLVVARAGASVLAEFPIARLPAVLVPLPIAGSHQMANARKLAEIGAAEIIQDHRLNSELAPTLRSLLADERRRLAMGAAAAGLARPQAARCIAQELYKLAGQPAKVLV